jgi:hypothetical protein
MKTSELKAAALDWAVARCEGVEIIVAQENRDWYSSSWEHGGPIIERELIEIYPIGVLACNVEWCARKVDTDGDLMYLYGDTPLISAMRCYVASKMGDEVELPEELNRRINHANG